MEKRRDLLRTTKVCRFCLSAQESLIPLYDNKVRAPKNSVPFALKILACIAIEIFPSDNMPQFICQRCKLFMELSYAFKQLCRQADEAILQYLQNGIPLDAIPWPSQLTKTYRSMSKSEGNILKTVVQGGATVKVLAEEISDSEEGEEDNVYNVKIGDGSEEGKSIKVITSIDQTVQKGRQGTPRNCEDADNHDVNVVPGCWPCDECECTYPLEQLLTLHKAQKHRVRSEICNECGGRFFSKNDLEVHQLTHSSEMPFQCVACGKKFKRLILLKRHEKVMHSELPQQSCPSCPATFLSVEELDAHQLKHERHPSRPFTCLLCSKRFPNKNLLQRHTAMVHGKKSDFSCQYCPEQFPSIAKLTRHVREHAGVRPYPCKHCDKSFTKSHHYTRHLRMKHAETSRTAGPYSEADAYRCDECEETFANQDELMYHSALHATRNLICPLCQEKFDDVDTVTAHIKSHVNGTEFMCDFCELIFTSKEKLENHIATSHDDELLANDQDTENDESSMDIDAEEDDDNSINVKEENGEMVVEIKKAGEYMLPALQTEEDKGENTQSEDSDMNYTDSPGTELDPMPTLKQNDVIQKGVTAPKVLKAAPKETAVVTKSAQTTTVQPATNSTILRKAEEVKRKAAVVQQQPPSADKKDKAPVKVETSSAATGASEKSLRLLEKELQDLKRTNSRAEAARTPAKSMESLKVRRPQLFSSTPKLRNAEKKDTIAPKSIPEKTIEKKFVDRKGKDANLSKEVKSNNNTIKEDRELKGNNKEEKETKSNKEDKELKGNKEDNKDTKGSSKEDKEAKGNKEDKEIKGNSKEDKVVKDEKKENSKIVVKNGASETPTSVSEDPVRRSSRPSKVKDYAKMIRDSSMDSDEEDDTDAEENEQDFKELDKTPETARARGRGRNTSKPPPTPAAKVAPSGAKPDAASGAPRKRGRPRKEPRPVVPSKIKKDEPSEEDADESTKGEAATTPKENKSDNVRDGTKTPEANKLPQEPRPGVIISPSGQTLKKVPIKALPPGVKPLPLPVNSRLGGGEVTEMQIGKKIVKVQKIVMTKAEVEAMTKKGLLEIKDGTMVLKQGIKLPAADPTALKSTLVGESDTNKESPKPLPTPMRCDLNE